MEHSTLQGRFQARFFWTVLALLALAVFPLVAPALGLDFYISFVRRVLIYALAATSLNLILGYGGMVALGHAAFFGAGAYAVGILAMNGVTSALVAWPAAALLAVIPCLLVFPLLSPIVVLLAILLYFKESRKAEEKVTERREKIEGELPRFVATVEQELGASRDVLTILENYKRHAGPDFVRELDVLTADMRSSSYEAALVRFEGRLASPMLSDIVRGLIGVLRGDDGRVYFQMLSHDMKQLELQRLKAQAVKIPPKIRVYSFVMLACFMLIYIVVILMQILTSMGGLFG